MLKSQFIKELEENGYKFESVSVNKNGVLIDAVSIKSVKNPNVGITAYDGLIKKFTDFADFEKWYIKADISIDASVLSDFDFVCENAFLCNCKDLDKKRLYYKQVGNTDFYACIRVMIDNTDGLMTAILPNTAFADNIDEIIESATYNTTMQAKFQSMAEFMADKLEIPVDIVKADAPDILIVSNDAKTYGGYITGAMAESIMEYFNEYDATRLVVLPSSIHEMLVAHLRPNETLENYNRIVSEVNETQLAPTEVLSNRAWLLSDLI